MPLVPFLCTSALPRVRGDSQSQTSLSGHVLLQGRSFEHPPRARNNSWTLRRIHVIPGNAPYQLLSPGMDGGHVQLAPGEALRTDASLIAH